MSDNVHGHTLPTKFNVNPDNPIFQRDQPDPFVAEIPQGLHGAPALRSELAENSANEQQAIALASVPQPAQDAAIEAADLTARNATIAADDAAQTAADAQANSDLVHQQSDLPAAEPLTEAESPVFETKEYSDGSSATGVAPLPDLSPEQQDASQPSAADLDAVAAEQATAEETGPATS
jgi:hypothetical protein